MKTYIGIFIAIFVSLDTKLCSKMTFPIMATPNLHKFAYFSNLKSDSKNKNDLILFFDHENIYVDPFIVTYGCLYTEIWSKDDFSIMAAPNLHKFAYLTILPKLRSCIFLVCCKGGHSTIHNTKKPSVGISGGLPP